MGRGTLLEGVSSLELGNPVRSLRDSNPSVHCWFRRDRPAATPSSPRDQNNRENWKSVFGLIKSQRSNSFRYYGLVRHKGLEPYT